MTPPIQLGISVGITSLQVLDNKSNGGESGIRTHVTLSSKHAFQACAFSHSAISPARRLLGKQLRGTLSKGKPNNPCSGSPGSILWVCSGQPQLAASLVLGTGYSPTCLL